MDVANVWQESINDVIKELDFKDKKILKGKKGRPPVGDVKELD